jgi:hypothetical protein
MFGGSMRYSGRWPRSGMMRAGEVCEHRMWALHTGASGGSVSHGWPTPDAGVFNYAETPASFDSRRKKVKQKLKNGNGMGAVLAVEAKRWPTMTVSEATRQHGWQRANGRIYPTLTGATGAAQAWPTPTAALGSSGQVSRGGSRSGELLLAGMARQWPPPSAHDWKGSTKPGQRRRQLTEKIEPHNPGRLNPEWVEILMGFPAGWTDIDGQPHPGHTSTYTSHPAPIPDSPPTSSD